MSRHHLLLLALGIISAFALGPSPAEAQNDFWALYNRYQYHQVGLSARSAAMGGAYTALQDNENTLVGNPASLGFLERRFVTGGFDMEDVASDLTLLNPNAPGEGEAELWSINVGGAYPFEWGGIGVQYSYRSDDLESDVLPSIAGFMEQDGDADRHYGGIGFGYKMMDELSLGYRFGYFDYELDRTWDVVRPAPFQFVSIEQEFQGHRHQLGVQYLPCEGVVMGLDGFFAFGDRDSALLGNADADSYGIRGGFAWKIQDLPLTVAMDLNYEIRDLDGGGNDEDEDLFGIHLGAEYEVYENLFLRAGYQFESLDFDAGNTINESLSMGGYTAGIGYKYMDIDFSYAFMYLDTGSGDTAHYFGVGYEF